MRHTLPNVEKICLNENAITSLRGLSHLQSLRELYVAYNEIKCLDFVRLQNLEKFWVTNNQLEHLHGLENLEALVDFDAAGNRIRALRIEHFPPSLTTLNL